MTIQELRVCQAYEQRLNLKSADIDRLKVDMQSKAKKINLLEEKITVQKATVDNYSKESVNGYNKLVSQHEDLTDRYNVWIPIYNSELEKYKASENDFNKSCANKTYYLDDMKTIQIDKKT